MINPVLYLKKANTEGESIMGLFNSKKLGDMLNVAKEKAVEISKEATDMVSGTVDKISNGGISNEEKERRIAEYNAKMENADLKMVAEVENFAGLSVGDISFIIDSAVTYKVKKGGKTEFPIFSGKHNVLIKYAVVKTKVKLNINQDCILYASLETATNLMKVELLDMDRNPIKDEGAIEVDYGKLYNTIKKNAVTSDNGGSCLDADVRVFGTDGQIYLYDDRIVIEREGMTAKMESGFTSSKIIPMSSVTAVHYKHRTDLGFGFIHIQENGKNGFNLITGTNKNKVTLNSNQDVDAVKEYIESRIGK